MPAQDWPTDIIGASAAASAIFSGLLVLFSARLWKVGRDQYSAAMKALDLANSEFISTHRPKLQVRVVRRVQTNIDDFWNAYVSVVNVGDTRAAIDAVLYGIWVRDPRSREWESRDINDLAKFEPPETPSSLEAGEEAVHWIRSKISTKDFVLDSLLPDGRRQICAFGRIKYRDDRAVVRETGFIWTYDFENGRFEPSDEPEFFFEN